MFACHQHRQHQLAAGNGEWFGVPGRFGALLGGSSGVGRGWVKGLAKHVPDCGEGF